MAVPLIIHCNVDVKLWPIVEKEEEDLRDIFVRSDMLQLCMYMRRRRRRLGFVVDGHRQFPSPLHSTHPFFFVPNTIGKNFRVKDGGAVRSAHSLVRRKKGRSPSPFLVYLPQRTRLFTFTMTDEGDSFSGPGSQVARLDDEESCVEIRECSETSDSDPQNFNKLP